MRFFRKSIAFILVLFILFAPPVSAVATGSPGQFDLDVVLVLDNSGSMNYSDPTLLAAAAANLFVDMNAGTDSRVGYVMYNFEIVGRRGLSDIVSFGRDIKNEISGMTYVGATDIAFGLETALEIFDSEPDRTRTPAIILLSDGHIQRPAAGHWRTEAEMYAAMDSAARLAADMGIPIFVIAFDHEIFGNLEMLQRMADISGGVLLEAQSASDLPGIMSAIYSILTGARSVNIFAGETTGYPQSVAITIPDNSIHRAMITIMASRPVQDISLTGPFGVPGHFYVNTDASGFYTLLTVMRPSMGQWLLTFIGTGGDSISIDLLSIYDLQLVLDLPVVDYAIAAGMGHADFNWRLVDAAGLEITDPYLISGLEPVLTVLNAAGETNVFHFAPGQQTMNLNLESGTYEAWLTLDDEGIVRVSNAHIFEVAPPPFDVWTDLPPMTDQRIFLLTIFRPSAVLNLADWILPVHRPVTVVATAGDWAEYVEWDYNPTLEEITLTAINTGSAEIRVVVTGYRGQVEVFFINVLVISGWVPIIALAALALIITVIIIAAKSAKKLRINDPMSRLYIKMTLPANIQAEYPPEAALTLPAIKGKRTLRAVINDNPSVAEAYRKAFEPINWFVDGTVLGAKSKSLLELKIPAHPGFTIKIDRQTGRNTAAFDKDGGAEVRLGFETAGGYEGYDEYIITFGMGTATPEGDASDGWDDFSGPEASANDDFW